MLNDYDASRPGYRFEGNNLREVVFPFRLYRYLRVSDLILSTISENYLWFSKAADLNDPFEVSDIFQKDFSSEEVQGFLMHNYKRMLERTAKDSDNHRIIEELLRKTPEMTAEKNEFAKRALKEYMKFIYDKKLDEAALCCFSDISDHPLLWSHYANGHRGICVIYDSTKLVGKETQILQVEYAQEPRIFPYIAKRLNLADSDRFQLEFSQAIFGQKSTEWAYESEFRLVSHKAGRNRIPAGAIIGVILGARMDESEKLKVSELLKSRSETVEVIEARIDSSKRTISAYPSKNMLVHLEVAGVSVLAGTENLGLERIFKSNSK